MNSIQYEITQVFLNPSLPKTDQPSEAVGVGNGCLLTTLGEGRCKNFLTNLTSVNLLPGLGQFPEGDFKLTEGANKKIITMISIKNVLHIKEFNCEAQNAIKMMADQLSRVSYMKKPMILYLEGTKEGMDLGYFDPLGQIEPRKFVGEKPESNVDIITVSSGTLDFVGTCLAMCGTSKRYATKDAKFTLNPENKLVTSNSEHQSCFDYDQAKILAKTLVDWDTGKAIALATGGEFGVKKAISLGIIDSVINLNEISEDKDCTEDFEDIYAGTFWW